MTMQCNDHILSSNVSLICARHEYMNRDIEREIEGVNSEWIMDWSTNPDVSAVMSYIYLTNHYAGSNMKWK